MYSISIFSCSFVGKFRENLMQQPPTIAVGFFGERCKIYVLSTTDGNTNEIEYVFEPGSSKFNKPIKT